MKENVNFNITPTDIGLSIEESGTYYDNISKGYIYINSTEVTNEKGMLALDELKEKFNLEVFDFSKHIEIALHCYSDELIIYFKGGSKSLFVTYFAKSPGASKKVWDILHDDDSKSEVYINVDTLSLIKGSLNRSNKVIERDDIDYVSKSYYPYMCIDTLFKEYFASHESILLLTGEPGLGKSKLATLAMKYAVDNPGEVPYPLSANEPYINLVFVRGTDILSSEEFWMDLEVFPPDFIIIDDLDNMLTTREADVVSNEDVLKNKFMNQFLSFTDGIEKRNTKFIITTNQHYKDIDSAVLRDGRLFDIIEMRQLHIHEALEIWKGEGLPENDFNELKLGNNITAAKLGSYIFKALHKHGDKSYLKEEGISKANDINNRRKIKI